jgi:hypothetical protein
MRVHGPDGRVWTVVRRTDPPRALGAVLPGGRWIVEATTDDEVRRWEAASRRAAAQLVDEVALALRTGAESPAGELPVRNATDGDEAAGSPTDAGAPDAGAPDAGSSDGGGGSEVGEDRPD